VWKLPGSFHRFHNMATVTKSDGVRSSETVARNSTFIVVLSKNYEVRRTITMNERNMYAAAALAGIMARGKVNDPEMAAAEAFEAADAMIAASEKPAKKPEQAEPKSGQ